MLGVGLSSEGGDGVGSSSEGGEGVGLSSGGEDGVGPTSDSWQLSLLPLSPRRYMLGSQSVGFVVGEKLGVSFVGCLVSC